MTESLVSWLDGGVRVHVVETAQSLRIFTTREGERRLLVEYGRDDIRSVIDRHGVDLCTLIVATLTGDERTFSCPPDVCVVLLVKLRKFQGVAEITDDALRSDAWRSIAS